MEEEEIQDFSAGTQTTLSIIGTEMARFKCDLSGQDLTDIPEDKLNEIRSIDFSNNRISSVEFILKCPNIIEIDASENQIGDGLQFFETLRFLTYLNLSANLFENLNEFPLIETLVTLDLSKNHLKSISDLPAFPLLKNLNLSHNSISELELPSLPSLQVLNLSGNVITHLTLPVLPSLRTLDASQNSIESIQEFEREALPFVWYCDLRNNALSTPENLKSLSKLPMLYNLQISHNPVTQSEEDHFAPILVILPTLTVLDDKQLNAKDKVKSELKVLKPEGMV